MHHELPKSCFDVLLRPIVFTDKTAQVCEVVLLCLIVFTDKTARVCEVVLKLKWFTTGRDRCRRSIIDVHNLSLGCVDLETCLLSIGIQCSSLLL